MKKIGNTEMWFRGEMDHRFCGREGTVVLKKDVKETQGWGGG